MSTLFTFIIVTAMTLGHWMALVDIANIYTLCVVTKMWTQLRHFLSETSLLVRQGDMTML